jgi:hypothetical protein
MLTPQERQHADSIGDTNPLLAPIPPEIKPRILVASVVRKPPEVVTALLQTLSWQKTRKPVEVSYAFLTDFAPADPFRAATIALLTDFAAKVERVTLLHSQNPGGDYGEGQGSRQWTPNAWHRVGALKNRLIQLCLDGRYDAIWLVDADVLCDAWTLQSLIDCDAPVVAGVYWTHWRQPQPGDTQVVHAGPQVWLRHPYILSGHGHTEASFRSALITRQLVRVWGLGACTLFHRAALEKGVNFTPVPEGLPPGPMADGEDRHLCERARRLHIPLYADAWSDIYHAYHPSEYGKIPDTLKRLERGEPVRPGLGDAVSIRLDCLEPIPVVGNPTMFSLVPPQFIRGRLGIMNLLPELEEAIAATPVGERKIITLHYPVHYEYDTLRGQSRLVAMTLLDAKPYGLAPTIEQECFVGARSGAIKDPTTLTGEQVDQVLEESNVRA